MALIQTGVDKLLKLVNSKEKVLVKDAAKELGVSETIVHDWAGFLEEEGYVKFEYKFSKTFIVKKELTEENIKEKEKEYSSQKEAFVRKAESMLQLVDRDSLDLEELKEEFDDIYKAVNEKKSLIKDDLDTIKKYEKSKDELDKKLQTEKEKYELRMKEEEQKVVSKSDEVKELLRKLKSEEDEISKDETGLDKLRSQEEIIQDKIDELAKLADNIKDTIKDKESNIKHSKEALEDLKEYAERIEDNLAKEKKKTIDPIIAEINANEKEAKNAYDKLIKKISSEKNNLKSVLKDTDKIEERLEKLFSSKMKAHTMVSSLSSEKKELQKELTELIKRVEALTAFSGTSIKQKVEQIKKLFDKLEEKEDEFKDKILGLSELLGMKR